MTELKSKLEITWPKWATRDTSPFMELSYICNMPITNGKGASLNFLIRHFTKGTETESDLFDIITEYANLFGVILPEDELISEIKSFRNIVEKEKNDGNS